MEEVRCFTEHCRSGDTFRADPNYRGSDEERRDFVWIEWEGVRELCLSKICLFVDLSTESSDLFLHSFFTLNESTVVEPGIFALIEHYHPLSTDDDVPKGYPEQRLRLLESNDLISPHALQLDKEDSKPCLFLADTESFSSTAIAIHDEGNDDDPFGRPVFLALKRPRREWHLLFDDYSRDATRANKDGQTSDDESLCDMTDHPTFKKKKLNT